MSSCRVYVSAIQNVFDDRVIRRGLWPSRSLDLNPCDFYLCGTLKSKVHVNNLESLEALKQDIRHEIGDISQNELRCVAGDVQPTR